MKAKLRLRKPDTNRVTCHHCFARKCIMNFYWLTPFAYSFVNSDRLELVIYFQNEKTNQKMTKMLSWSTLQTTAIYDEVPSQGCATFGILGIF